MRGRSTSFKVSGIAAIAGSAGTNIDSTYLFALVDRPAAAIVVVSLWLPDGERDEIARFDTGGLIHDQVLTQIEQAATAATAEMSGTQRIHVAVVEQDGRTVVGVAPFRVEGGLGTDPDMPDPPTAGGVTHLLMVQNAQLHRHSMAIQSGSVGWLAAENRRLNARIEKLEAEREAMFEMKEKLLSKQEERDVMREDQTFRHELWAKGLDVIRTYLPVAVNKLLGKEVVHQRLSALELSAMELADRLSTKSLDDLSTKGVLSSNDLMALATFMENIYRTTKMVSEAERRENEERLRAMHVAGSSSEFPNPGGTGAS